MSQTVARAWTVAEFFAWQERQEHRYELVEGFPVRMMAGTRKAHDRIAINILAELRLRLRGSGCEPFSGELSLETLPGQIRRPDAGIDCGPTDDDALTVTEPKMVAEILSPSTRDFDTMEKVPEYKGVGTLDYILVVEPNAPDVVVWTRGPDRTWAKRRIESLDEAVPMPTLGLDLPLSEIYRDVAFASPPPLRFGRPDVG